MNPQPTRSADQLRVLRSRAALVQVVQRIPEDCQGLFATFALERAHGGREEVQRVTVARKQPKCGEILSYCDYFERCCNPTFLYPGNAHVQWSTHAPNTHPGSAVFRARHCLVLQTLLDLDGRPPLRVLALEVQVSLGFDFGESSSSLLRLR